jgi:hypothetical protein
VFGAILLAGLIWYWYLLRTRPDVARRVGTIQTLSEAEQQRLADAGILGELTDRTVSRVNDDDPDPQREKEVVAP